MRRLVYLTILALLTTAMPAPAQTKCLVTTHLYEGMMVIEQTVNGSCQNRARDIPSLCIGQCPGDEAANQRFEATINKLKGRVLFYASFGQTTQSGGGCLEAEQKQARAMLVHYQSYMPADQARSFLRLVQQKQLGVYPVTRQGPYVTYRITFPETVRRKVLKARLRTLFQSADFQIEPAPCRGRLGAAKGPDFQVTMTGPRLALFAAASISGLIVLFYWLERRFGDHE